MEAAGGQGGARAGRATPAPVFTEQSARRRGPVRRFLVRHPAVTDALLALVFLGWAGLIGLGADSMYALSAYLGGERVLQMQTVLLALMVVGAAALMWRRRRPVVVAGVMGVLAVAALAAAGATSGFELGLALALYTVAAASSPRITWVTAAATVSACLVAARVLDLPATVGAIAMGVDPAIGTDLEAATRQAQAGGFLQSAVWYQTAAPVLVLALLAVAVGTSARNQRLHLAAFVEQANALAREQEQRALVAQAAERARIAREMHDVVAHSISVMIALGGGARAAVDWAPDRSREALDELVATGRAALGDVRRVLGVLHDDGPRPPALTARPGDDAGPADGRPDNPRAGDVRTGSTDAVHGDDPTPFEPQPSSVDLGALVERFRSAGLPVRTTGLADTGLTELDANRQLAVYRVVQEALTNVLRHAPGTPAVDVAVRRDAGTVEVVVTDGGPTLPVDASPGSQRGLVGMCERVAAFGGEVETGPYGRGWRVRALLPSDEGDA
ncbi:sensor histidine kinase [Cellulomonas cellasea]|uniref:sensor histidine kinase n=1 Tax=Cellulomonas cellasea TaxID=43670 RepID=UPI001142A6AF|nr:histidine kinase [Cellulomonas cellasea]